MTDINWVESSPLWAILDVKLSYLKMKPIKMTCRKTTPES